jgi:hypothetical protein
MRPATVTVTPTGVSQVIPLDWNSSPFNVGIGVIVTGTSTYTVEHTFDDVFSPTFTPASANWLPNTGLTAQTASKDGNYAFPVRGVRLNVTAGTGSVTMTVLQGLAH